ncbi:MAG: NAD kinase [Prevotella sp.]|nr:NAD kinase [Prevotella sp.]
MRKDKVKTFALFGNVYQCSKSAAISKVLACLQHEGARVLIEREYFDFLCASGLISDADNNGSSIETFTGSNFEADFALSMGGDGTLLRTASLVGSKPVPILGVNIGRLGFMADSDADDFHNTLLSLYSGDYTTEQRALIQVNALGEEYNLITDGTAGHNCALNDVAILKRDTASMISIRTCINGEYLTTYQADGLIVSTPTGSTAYSLSNGGPIIVPGTGVMLLTAVAPHSLNVRPIVIPDTAVVEVTVSSRSHTFLVAIDGRSTKMPEGTTLHLQRAPYKVSVVKRSGTRYFSTLREKMMWGADLRK